MRSRLVAAALVLIGHLAVVASEAEPTGAPASNDRIQVRVTDESGASLNGATVTARLTWKTKPSGVATSSPDGMAELRGLRAHELYVVRVAKIEFADAEVDVVPAKLSASEPLTVTLSRDVCDMVLKMDGAGWTRLIDPDRATTSMVFSSWYLTGLPGGGGSEVVPEECRRKAEK